MTGRLIVGQIGRTFCCYKYPTTRLGTLNYVPNIDSLLHRGKTEISITVSSMMAHFRPFYINKCIRQGRKVSGGHKESPGRCLVIWDYPTLTPLSAEDTDVPWLIIGLPASLLMTDVCL